MVLPARVRICCKARRRETLQKTATFPLAGTTAIAGAQEPGPGATTRSGAIDKSCFDKPIKRIAEVYGQDQTARAGSGGSGSSGRSIVANSTLNPLWVTTHARARAKITAIARPLLPLLHCPSGGYRRARHKARRELRALAQSLDDELVVLQDDIAAIELEFRRRQALQEAIVERISITPDALLH